MIRAPNQHGEQQPPGVSTYPLPVFFLDQLFGMVLGRRLVGECLAIGLSLRADPTRRLLVNENHGDPLQTQVGLPQNQNLDLTKPRIWKIAVPARRTRRRPD